MSIYHLKSHFFDDFVLLYSLVMVQLCPAVSTLASVPPAPIESPSASTDPLLLTIAVCVVVLLVVAMVLATIIVIVIVCKKKSKKFK